MRVIPLLLGAACALFFQAASAQAPTAADIARAQAEATKTAVQYRNQTGSRDTAGNIITNADGTVVQSSNSSLTKQKDLEFFKSMTGIDGLEQVASPGSSGRAGLVNISSTQTFDLSCKSALAGATQSAGGLTFLFSKCEGTPVQRLTFSVCDAQQRTSQCSSDADFSQQISIPVGSFATVSGVKVGAGCNSTNDCRISVKGTLALGGNEASLNAQVAAKSGKSSYLTDLRTNIENGTYAEKTKELGQPMMDCAERNRISMAANGTVTSCGVSEETGQPVTVSTSKQDAAACSSERKCIRYGTTSQSFTRSCARTFPLTERVTKYHLDTAECSVTKVTDEKGVETETNSCVAPEDQGGADARKGKSLIGQTSAECTKNDPITNACISRHWVEYFASTSATVISTADSPAPVAGACDNNPMSETRYTGYTGGEWFGRTLANNECTAEIIDEGGGGGMYYQLTNAEKAGCGIYTTPTVGTTCYGAPSATDDVDSCKQIDLNSCRLIDVVPSSYSGGNGGLVIAQQENYQCEKEQKPCLEWSTGSGENACLNVEAVTFGTDQAKTMPADSEALNAAMVAAAVADASAEGVNNEGDPFMPLIFSGEDMRCERATGGIGQLFGRNCCRMDLERPISGQLTRDGCKMPAVKLAAARRSLYTVYIGEYCSKRMKFPRRCLQQTQTYCSFNGILPRLIHEQGRVQLAKIAASSTSSDVARRALNFTYLDSGTGSWTSPFAINGALVSAWKWPNYCVDPVRAGEFLAANPDAFDCPGVVRTVIASCDDVAGCGDLPAAPEYGAALWNMVEVNPLQLGTTALNRFAVATGACSTESGTCGYEVASWPVGQGGKAVVTRDIAWPAYSNEAPTATSAGLTNQMTNMADLMFRTWSAAGVSDGKTVPPAMRIDYSKNGGQSWSTVQVPTDLRGKEFTFPGSDTKMSGQCEPLTNLCAFRVTGTSVIMAKSWGEPQRPDCTGFTGGQLSAMDFGKMDLSEWLATVMETAASVNPTALAKTAATQFESFNSMFQGGSGTLTVSTPVSANFARITPNQGFGPFETRLVVSGFWPQTTGDKALDVDRVTKVVVDWGDCTPTTTLPMISPTTAGSGYIGTHTFVAPNDLKCGARKANVTQSIKMTVYTTKSGVLTRNVSVENAWAVFPGGQGKNNDNVEIKVTTPINNGGNLPPKP